MSRFKMLLFAVVGILASSMSVFAQAAAEVGDNASSVSKYRALAAGVGFAIAVFGGNPGAAGRIQTMMILGLALIESLVLFALLVVFAVVKPS
jgi:F-type H+-transporting ATPase subunit c